MSNVLKDFSKQFQSGGSKSGTQKEFVETFDILGIDPSSDPLGVAEFLGFGPTPGANVADPTFRSGDSTITKAGVSLDPNLQEARERGLSMTEEGLRGVQESRIGSRQDFLNKRLDPLKKGLQQQQTALTQRQQKTGVTESEFGKQTQEALKVSSQQKLEQGEAMAFNEVMSVASQLDQSEGNILKLQEHIKSAQFAQDAQARGMSRQLLSSLVDIDLRERGIRGSESATKQAQAGTAISLLGQFFSSRTFKENMKPIDNQQILDSMMELSVEKWKYTGEDKEYIGCYAEDFNERFGEKGGKTINAIDIIGVLMASIQAQQVQIEELKRCL